DVLLPRVTGEQGYERRQHGHEKRDAFFSGQLLNGGQASVRNPKGVLCSLESWDVRAGAAGGDLGPRKLRQLCSPIGKLSLSRLLLNPLALPYREVGILNGQVGQGRWLISFIRLPDRRHF